MRNKKSTKRALVASVISLMLCFTMLLGTTYAWFTDSVTSTNNIIKSGNLDVELYWSTDASNWTKVAADTNVFTSNLWEPGHTEVVYLKVVNEGSLALKYQLGVNVADEVGSKNVLGKEFKLSDYIMFGVVDYTETYADRDAAIADVDDDATALNVAYNSDTTTLASGADDVVAMVVYMPTTVGNDANHAKGENVPTIKLGLNLFATQVEHEKDSFDENYDKDAIVIVKDAEEAQAALDNAAEGAIIMLSAGVDYGTLYLRPFAGGTATKNVDWIGNNYGWETYTLYENVTIVGADGATVDAIEIEGGTYYYTEHSQDSAYPVMLSLVELKNVVIDGVTFTGKGGYDPQGYGNAINLSGNNIKVDGLTLKNCVLENENNNARMIYKTESTTHVHKYAYDGVEYTFVPSLKDITVTGCTFNGGYMGLELRETENVTITNNVFNVADRNILLPINTDCTYTGNVTITGNVSNNAQERFVRADGMGDAVVVIKDNVLNNYMGADADYIKVTNATNVTVDNNTMTRALNATSTTSLNKFVDVFAAGGTIFLRENATVDTSSNKNITVNGDVHIYADNGQTLTFPKTTVFGGNGKIIVHSGKIETPQELCISGNATLVIDGGEHTFGAFSATGNGTIIVNDGILNCKGTYAGVMGISFGETGSLYVNGGKLNMYQPINLNANRCDSVYVEINGGTIELLNGIENLFVVRNVMDKDNTSGVYRGSSVKITGGTFIAHYEVDYAGDATSFIRNGDGTADTNRVLVSDAKDRYNCVVTGGTFYGSWQRADNTRYENSDGLMVDNSIEGFVANGYQIVGNPDDGYVVSKS